MFRNEFLNRSGKGWICNTFNPFLLRSWRQDGVRCAAVFFPVKKAHEFPMCFDYPLV